MKILIVGSGAREHAIAWKLAQSPDVSKLICSPGNPGIAQIATCVPAPVDVSGYLDVAEAHDIDLTIVGPEAPLVAGIVDQFKSRGRNVVGPTQAASRLEGSKIFAKQFFQRAGIPTARSVQVSSYAEAFEQMHSLGFPLVVKADGLAAGKGVVIAEEQTKARRAIEKLGPHLVLEEFLLGEEVSFIGISNGLTCLPLAPSQDHKRAFNGDQGPNTGGMGAYCDKRILTSAASQQVMDCIMMPAIHQMQVEGNPFTGFLYAGLMMTEEGPKVLEFNVRLGDPETQALLCSYEGDFLQVIEQAVSNEPTTVPESHWSSPSVCVVLAAKGYPTNPITGQLISGASLAEEKGAQVFHAGTTVSEGKLLANGGRVLSVCASAATLGSAIAKTYTALQPIHFEGMHYRLDIGQKGLKRW